ncbi:hypothetical protein L6D11_22050, partial [Staphylococcus aureus]|nr:hypothetical protein [Staphylococcus aureus]
VKEPLLIAAKHNTDTVIAEMIAITVNENAFFLIRNMSDDVKITSFTETLPPLRYLIVFKMREIVLRKKK